MNRRGVTLIELVVVMVIIGICAVLMVPNMGAWLPNYRLKSATRDITSTFRTANMKAVSTNLEHRVNLDASGNYSIERGNQSSGSTAWVLDGAVNTLPTGVTKNFTGNIQFNPDSTCSNPGTITLTNNKGKQSSITLITATGKVNVSS